MFINIGLITHVVPAEHALKLAVRKFETGLETYANDPASEEEDAKYF